VLAIPRNTGGTRNAAVDRQAVLKIQFPAQFDFLFGQSVVLGNIGRFRVQANGIGDLLGYRSFGGLFLGFLRDLLSCAETGDGQSHQRRAPASIENRFRRGRASPCLVVSRSFRVMESFLSSGLVQRMDERKRSRLLPSAAAKQKFRVTLSISRGEVNPSQGNRKNAMGCWPQQTEDSWSIKPRAWEVHESGRLVSREVP